MGLLHHLLGIRTTDDLSRHPKVGASFEGFAVDAVIRRLGADRRECHFWATHQGAELDLLVVRGRDRVRAVAFDRLHQAVAPLKRA